eukprot:TRINITY_DN2770_c0_g1_i1.p1 TRINITY_DN2770_c0_g1~~TRINITY_DN2770_c0_g1_i1.p1  ORF type:complete len:224 (+),score=52.74 TRINITY_DN2770_c0_g1_i1:257-928(+)
MSTRTTRSQTSHKPAKRSPESLPDSDNDSVDPFAFDDKADVLAPMPTSILGKRKQPSTPTTQQSAEVIEDPALLAEMREMLKQLESLKAELAQLKREQAVNVQVRQREEALAAARAADETTPSPAKKLKTETGSRPSASAASSDQPARRRRSMTPVQRKKLYLGICKLGTDHLSQLLELVRKICPRALVASSPDSEEVELDLSIIPSTRLWELQEFVNRNQAQ